MLQPGSGSKAFIVVTVCVVAVPKSFLRKQHAILVHDESHHPRVTVLGGIGREAESADHFSTHYIVFRPSRCVAGLALQDAEIVAMEGFVPIGLCGIAFGGCRGRERAERALGLALRRLPVQAVVPARITDKLHGVLFCGFTIVDLREVLGLSVRRSMTNLARSPWTADMTSAACR